MLENAGIDLMRLAQIHTYTGTPDTVEARPDETAPLLGGIGIA
jgi:hypothetical protein